MRSRYRALAVSNCLGEGRAEGWAGGTRWDGALVAATSR